MITVQVENDPNLDPISKTTATFIATTVFSHQKQDSVDLTIIFTDDTYLSRLKKDYFGKNQFTDVIAFTLNDPEEALEGEIYISVPRAEENARKFKEPLKKEIARLIIHGSLHLLDFDDQTEDEKKTMRDMEEQVLQQVDWETL